MKSLWSFRDAADAVSRYAAAGVNADRALRVYTTRLLGGVPALVQHGGGNTSVKTTLADTLGDAVEVLCVKGSGWDMAAIEPAGLPAVRLGPLRRLERLDALSDEDMVNVQRCNLLDATAPNPSVETLFHAFLPQRFVDHTHAVAILALTDQPDGEARARDLFGARAAVLDYVMPGFALAKAAAAAQRAAPQAEGLVLSRHGLFTWGDSAREAYERMIALVSLAEDALARGARSVARPAAPLPPRLATAAQVAPILRGLAAVPLAPEDGRWQRWVLDFRGAPDVVAYASGAEAARYACAGTVTPDHVIRLKPKPLLVPAPAADDLAGFAGAARAAFAAYARDYEAYFGRHNARVGGNRIMLDTVPRVILVPGLGLFALGASAAEARIAGDLAVTTAETVGAAEALGRYQSIAEADQFDMEYWSLEQAKLGKQREKPLARQIAVVTGGGSGIGAATAAALAAEGATVAVLDRNGDAAAAAAKPFGGLALACDVTRPAEVDAAFAAVAERLGGVDIVVSNAGAAWQGAIGTVDEATLRASFELNFFAHQAVAQTALALMRAQGTGGALLFNVSKQAVNPGRDLGPYGLPKAALLALVRQYALDHGRDGIRANAVNADRVRTGLLTDDFVQARAAARGVTAAAYMRGNLLGREVRPADVAQAFVFLAQAQKTTGAVLTVDGGNIEAALR